MNIEITLEIFKIFQSQESLLHNSLPQKCQKQIRLFRFVVSFAEGKNIKLLVPKVEVSLNALAQRLR
jgi:hypothetical protein